MKIALQHPCFGPCHHLHTSSSMVVSFGSFVRYDPLVYHCVKSISRVTRSGSSFETLCNIGRHIILEKWLDACSLGSAVAKVEFARVYP